MRSHPVSSISKRLLNQTEVMVSIAAKLSKEFRENLSRESVLSKSWLTKR